MTTIKRYVCLGWLALGGASLLGSTITPDNIGAVCGVQPFAGGAVVEGATDPPFFSVPGSACPGPVVTILAGITLYDEDGNPLFADNPSAAASDLLGVSVEQGGSSFILPLDTFATSTNVPYGPTLDTLNSVVVVPGQANLSFTLPSSSPYSYSLLTDGDSSIGFATWNDVEAAPAPELSCMVLTGVGLMGLARLLKRRAAPAARAPRVIRSNLS
jgi:hypothetical protein